MKAQKEKISSEETFIGNIKRVVNSEKIIIYRRECPDIRVTPAYETTGDIARYSANIQLYLKKEKIEMVFSLPVLTSDSTPTLFPCLTYESIPKPYPTKYDGPDEPQVLNNTLEMIFFGWMTILNKISNLPLWAHKTDFRKLVASNRIPFYRLLWEPKWYGSPIPKYKRTFEIRSWLDSTNNTFKFNIKTDKDTEFVTFNINEIDKLIMHIDNHLEYRYWYKARYEEQIQRIELLLHAANAKC